MTSADARDPNPLPADVRAELQELQRALVQGRDVVARNLLSYLDAEVLPTLQDDARGELSRQTSAMNEQLRLPRKQRFLPPRPHSSRRPASMGFRCAFCRQQWGWDSAMALPKERGFACTNCAKTVMCPSCGGRKLDEYATCYRCSGAQSVSSKPHGFHL